MELRQLEYVIAIADHGSISKAAESLFITQSGLNQQLIKLEQELGIQLFYRDKHHLQVTAAGRIYVENAREIMKIKKNTYNILSDMKNNTVGEITLGLTLEHGIDLFTFVFPKFNRQYPGINFHLLERYVAEQHSMIAAGKLDFGLVMLGEQDKVNLEYIPLYQEEMILGVPKTHPCAGQCAAPGEPMPFMDLKLFKEDTFALMFPNSTMRGIIDPAFAAAGYQPKILIETGMNHALVKLAATGLCCTVLPFSRALCSPDRDAVSWFRLSPPISWTTYITYRKNTHLNEASRYFIQLAKEYGAELAMQMRRPFPCSEAPGRAAGL